MKVQRICILFLASLLATAGLSLAVNPEVTLEITGGVEGTIVIEVYADVAPITAENFIQYVEDGFYDGLIFHRVIPDFMTQTGGFDPNLVQQPTRPDIINESYNALSNLRGTIAMARLSDPQTASSQFFINHADNLFLDYSPLVYDQSNNAYSKYGYCVFGHVVSGMDVVDAIAGVATQTENGYSDVPVTDIVIQSATLTLNAPVCAEKLIGDINEDCSVNFLDVALLTENWADCNSLTICN